MSFHFSRVDANQERIIKALRQIGCTVHVVTRCPFDIIAARHGVNYLLEIKDGNKAPSQQKLTTAQEKFKAEWKGQWTCVNNVNDALRVVSGQRLWEP